MRSSQHRGRFEVRNPREKEDSDEDQILYSRFGGTIGDFLCSRRSCAYGREVSMYDPIIAKAFPAEYAAYQKSSPHDNGPDDANASIALLSAARRTLKRQPPEKEVQKEKKRGLPRDLATLPAADATLQG